MEAQSALPSLQQSTASHYPITTPRPHNLDLKSTLILSSYRSLEFPTLLLPSGFPIKPQRNSPVPHAFYMPSPLHSS